MTEAQWLSRQTPQPMLDHLVGRAGDRKLRLYAVALLRPWSHLLVDERSRAALLLAERVAEGSEPPERLPDAHRAAWDALRADAVSGSLVSAARAAGRTVEPSPFLAARYTENEVVQLAAGLAEERATSVDGQDAAYWQAKAKCEASAARLLRDIFGNPFGRVDVDPAWVKPNVGDSARSIYSEGAFDRLPKLAEDLVAAGCADRSILEHCRGRDPHARGCWVVDLILGKR